MDAYKDRKKILYWSATIVFAILLIADGLGGVFRAEAGKEVFIHLGYPLYLLSIVGYAKIAAALAILQTKYPMLKEWAFAGFAMTCYGAFMSRIYVGDALGDILFPVLFFAIMLIPYVLWKRYRPASA